MNVMSKDPRIKALANQAAVKIKILTQAHQIQIEAIYREFQEEAADIQGSNGDELHTHTATPVPQSTGSQQEQ